MNIAFIVGNVILVLLYRRELVRNRKPKDGSGLERLMKLQTMVCFPLVVLFNLYTFELGTDQTVSIFWLSVCILSIVLIITRKDYSQKISDNVYMSLDDEGKVFLHFSYFPKSDEIDRVLTYLKTNQINQINYKSHLLSNERKSQLCKSIMKRKGWYLVSDISKKDTLTTRLLLTLYIVYVSIRDRRKYKIYGNQVTLTFKTTKS